MTRRRSKPREVVDMRPVRRLRRRALVESWAWRHAGHDVRPGWRDEALCRRMGTEAWFDLDRTRRYELFVICERCPVRLDCGTDAMLHEQREPGLVHGVRAGMGPNERAKAARIFDRLRQTV